jgi:hypothetical protein
VIGVSLAVPDPAGYPEGEDPGLARAGTGQHAHRLCRLIDGEAL